MHVIQLKGILPLPVSLFVCTPGQKAQWNKTADVIATLFKDLQAFFSLPCVIEIRYFQGIGAMELRQMQKHTQTRPLQDMISLEELKYMCAVRQTSNC